MEHTDEDRIEEIAKKLAALEPGDVLVTGKGVHRVDDIGSSASGWN